MPNQLQQRVSNYVDLLNNDIVEIQNNLNDTQTLAESNDPETLHTTAERMIQRQMNPAWVQVPRQYSAADDYLIAMDRFMQLAGVVGYSILLPVDTEAVTLVMTDLNTPAAFAFETNNDQNGGAFFTELSTGERLFYWSLERKQILFNARGIVDLLVDRFSKKNVTVNQNRVIAAMLTEFGRYMERVFGYKVDFNILETLDDYHYDLIQHAEPKGMLDKLFVLSGETNYFLQGMPNGAAIMLGDQTEVRIFFINDANALGAQRWHFQVVDGRDQYSWLDVLFNYDFIAKWYLDEQKTMEIAYDELVFAVQKSRPVDIQSIFTAQQGLMPMMPQDIEAEKAKAAAAAQAEQDRLAQVEAEKEAQAKADAQAEADRTTEADDAEQDDADEAAVTREVTTDEGEFEVGAEAQPVADDAEEAAETPNETKTKSFDEEIQEALSSSNNSEG
ncbi:hypothetical protein JOC36_000160 [Weissella uvarum]|uniref:hypothetical protein n=1 Tax=Weissella uvarum TaxID=1479233 RepID=UPI001960C43E|nr:hypothetical protein [Weissella uvarum]MBM7616627.1 hypothetical protein [Weissella uvarum]MCM0594915.1 hypothetical protein [Weissella uvarum]